MVTLEINSESMFISIVFKRHRKTLITVFPPISVFLTVYPSQCVPYTVSQQGSSFLRTVNLVFFISLSFIVFHQSWGTFTGVSEEGTPNLPFAKAT